MYMSKLNAARWLLAQTLKKTITMRRVPPQKGGCPRGGLFLSAQTQIGKNSLSAGAGSKRVVGLRSRAPGPKSAQSTPQKGVAPTEPDRSGIWVLSAISSSGPRPRSCRDRRLEQRL